MMSYPPEQLRGEVAYVAFYLHWSYEQIMHMDHHERRSWVSEVSEMNKRLNEAQKEQRF